MLCSTWPLFQILCASPCSLLCTQKELPNIINYTNGICIQNHSINVSSIYSYMRLKKITCHLHCVCILISTVYIITIMIYAYMNLNVKQIITPPLHLQNHIHKQDNKSNYLMPRRVTGCIQ